MKSTQYHLIDQKFILEGKAYPFKIFGLNPDGETVKVLLFSHTPVKKTDLAQMKNMELYILKEEEEAYEDFAIAHLKEIDESEGVAYNAKVKVILNKAEHIMATLFANPETLGNIGSVEAIVTDLVESILDEHFAINSLMAIAAHDYYTHTHSINVSIYALSLGKFLKLSKEELIILGEAALMHDLGKSRIRADVINKHGKLTSYEFEYMKRHPQLSYDIAKEMGVSDEKILDAIKHHHEKLDGSGYPDHLKYDKVSHFARILCICDVFDALTTKRSYKDPLSTFETLKMMKKEMSHELDTHLLNSFILMMHA